MEIKKVPIKNLKASEYNPRLLSLEQETKITESIKKFGMVEPIIVNFNKERKNVVIGGHQRLMICKKLGHTEMPVVYVNLNKDDERELNIRLNRNHGEFDWDVLLKEFDPLNLKLWGFSDVDFPKIPKDVIVSGHTRKKGAYSVIEVKCENEESADNLSAELAKRGYKVILKKSES